MYCVRGSKGRLVTLSSFCKEDRGWDLAATWQKKKPRKGSVLLAQYRAKRFRIAEAIRNPLRQRGCEGLGPFRSNFAFAGAKDAGTPYSQYFFEILGMKSGRVAGGSGKGLNRSFCTLRSCHFFGESGFEKRIKKEESTKAPYCTSNTERKGSVLHRQCEPPCASGDVKGSAPSIATLDLLVQRRVGAACSQYFLEILGMKSEGAAGGAGKRFNRSFRT